MGIKAAMGAGACWVEFDVQMCRDGRFILLHDATLERTSNSNKSIFDVSSNDLKNISFHEPRRFGNKFYPLPITTLESVCRKLTNYPKINAMVEIKEESLQHWGVARVMEFLLEQLESSHEHCVLISFSFEALEYAREHSDIKIGWVLPSYDRNHVLKADSLKPDYLICNHSKIPRNTHPWPGPWKWMLYGITSSCQALEWGGMGVDLIETDDIRVLFRDTNLASKACYHGV